MGIPVPDGYFLSAGTNPPADFPLSFPVIVKPNAADNSAGMTTDCIAYEPADLQAVDSVRHYVGSSRALIIEEFLTGADLTYGVIGNPSGISLASNLGR